MRVLVDMNLSPVWSEFFARQGIDAVHWREIGAFDAPDAEIFAWARAHDRVVFTHDLDFSMILAASQALKPSVVQLRHPNLDPTRHGQRVVALLREHAAELDEGALLSIEPDQKRLRLLPLRT
jgi:predicted nuclease of predicted toxin-antitoxin system